jgi:hypothetical protein
MIAIIAMMAKMVKEFQVPKRHAILKLIEKNVERRDRKDQSKPGHSTQNNYRVGYLDSKGAYTILSGSQRLLLQP